MPPRQPYQPGPGPQQPGQPFPPQPGQYSYGTPGSQQFQQHPNGQYEVVPALPQVQNDGHSGHNPYEFIVNPNTQTRPGFSLALTSSSLLTRIALLGGVLVIIMIIAAVIISALSPKSVTPELISIAQRQQEIIRVSTAAVNQTSSSDAKNLAVNVEASVTTSQVQITGYLSAHGTKLSSKTLMLDQSTQTDSQLANAATANNYDGALTQYLIDQLQTYEGLLQTAFNQSHSTQLKAVLQSNYSSAALLVKQAKAIQGELSS